MATILLTHREGEASPLSQRLRQAGHIVSHCPLLTVSSCLPVEAVQTAVASAGTLILTSRAAAEALQSCDLQGKHLLAIGPATAETLQSRGGMLHLAPKQTADALLTELQRLRHDLPQPWLYLRGETVRTDLVALAATLGMAMRQLILYRQQPDALACRALAKVASGQQLIIVASRLVTQYLVDQPDFKHFPPMIWLAYSQNIAEPLTGMPNPPRVEVIDSPGVEGVLHWLKAHSF